MPWSKRRQLVLPVAGVFAQLTPGTSVVLQRLLQVSKLSEKSVPLYTAYVDGQTFLGDCRILLRTLISVVRD